MYKSRLAQILRHLTKKEFRDLRKWVQSPSHNQRQDVIDLYEYLLEDDRLHKPDFLNKETVFRWIYSNEKYDDAKMRQVMFFLMKTVEEYLIFNELQQDEVLAKNALSGFYRKRKLYKPFQKNLRLTRNLQQSQKIRNGHYLRNSYLLEQEEYLYLGELRSRRINLQEVSNALDVTYIADKLKQSCFMVASQRVFNKEYDIGLLTEVLQFIEAHPDLLEIPAIAIYYYGYKTTTDRENEDHFQSLKEEIFKSGHFFSSSEQGDIYLMAINYCIGRMNQGLDQFIREGFELFKRGFENKVLFQNDTIPRTAFLNTINIGLKLKEFTWLEEFITNYQKYLDPEHRESYVNICQASISYHKKEYSKAMEYLLHFDNVDDILINLQAKRMLLNIYYEQKEFAALESLLESMRNYLVRKKVIGYHKANYKNIIRYTKKLLMINPYSTAAKDKLRKEITATNPLTEKNWLLNQLDSLQ